MATYETYKDSGIEWIGDIPEHWEVKRLKYIGDSIIGITYNPKEVVQENGTLVLRSSNIQNGKLSLKDTVYINKEIPERLETKIGDILICSRNGSRRLIGKNITIDEKTKGETFGAFMTIFRTDQYQFISKYFNSQVFSGQSGLFLTSTINQLTINTLNNFYTALPPEVEQKMIANYLDEKTAEIDKLIEQKKKLLKLYEKEKEVIINQAVTKGLNSNVKLKASGIECVGEIPVHWEVKRIRHIAKIFGRIGYRGYKTTDLVAKEEGAITISPSNMKKYHMDFDSCTYLSWEKYEESPEIKIFNEDILFVKTGSTYGKVSFVKNLPEKATINPQIIVFKEVNCVNEFLYYILKSQNIEFQVESTVVGGTIPTISQAKINNYTFPIPNNDEQLKIVEYIKTTTAKVDTKLNKTKKLIALLIEYKTTLISDVVTGKIKVY